MSGKYYVVWSGHRPGIYDKWSDCQAQVKEYPNARYKSFKTRAEAELAYKSDPPTFYNKVKAAVNDPVAGRVDNSLAVDAACSGNPGEMEYRGVHVGTGEEWFHQKFALGTNNIGEFLAVVHGLAELNKRGLNIPVYSDSGTAIAWVRNKKCKTKLPENEKTAMLFEMIRRAEKWLATNTWEQPLLKWETNSWGEIPADFGRK